MNVRKLISQPVHSEVRLLVCPEQRTGRITQGISSSNRRRQLSMHWYSREMWFVEKRCEEQFVL